MRPKFLNSFFKGQGKLEFESQNSFPYPLKSQPLPSLAFLFYKSERSSATLEGFFKGIGVVKGEGAATAKKRPPSHLKIKRISLLFQIFAKNSFEFFVAKIFFKGQGKL
ncbi:hypothetical protein V2I28_02300 [Campylobacter sp. CX2-4080-23]|uniref:hypothetical protein n=1 Tax=Campylobacter porcelli TaxID=1660073 RepID=UPI002E9830F6|nr:hypothetical protein [Campylobacter sp. CX2-4080-23]